jgi:hypothetical protein
MRYAPPGRGMRAEDRRPGAASWIGSGLERRTFVP